MFSCCIPEIERSAEATGNYFYRSSFKNILNFLLGNVTRLIYRAALAMQMGELPYLAVSAVGDCETDQQIKHSYGLQVHEQTPKGAYVPTNI